MRTMWLFCLLFCSCRSSDYKLDTGGGVVEETGNLDTGNLDTGSPDTSPPLVDADGDGHDESTDCDDNDPLIHPGADEVCDGTDNNCDGEIDEPSAIDAATWYADVDGDGHGDPNAADLACEQPSGFVSDNTDCDDDATSNHPGALEICDGADNDCDGTTDEPDAVNASPFYADTDSDGHGDPANTTTACTPPSGFVADDTDCDDSDASSYPGAAEFCDGVDHDCDGAVNEVDSVDTTTWHLDYDADGFGNPAATIAACSAPFGYLADDTDCNDLDATSHPGGIETCDGADNDCDGSIDEPDAVDAITFYADTDSDGFGDPANTTAACSAPSGFQADDTDCDDTSVTTYPGATEFCDGVDHDCDGAINEVDSFDASTFYLDYDSDGFGNLTVTTTACSAPSGYVTDSNDCNDVDAATYPGATETCDGADNNCDTDIDELLTGSGTACPGTSCLNVLEDGTPTASGSYWIDPNGSGAFQEYCDYGTVGGAWAYRVDFTIENATGDHLYDQQVALTLDTQQLITDGKMQSNSADLRFFTHDGPLLNYWYETSTLPSTATVVWVVLPEIAANSTINHTLTYGNPDTEARSLAWHFDEFESDTSADYDLHFDASWDTPEFLWNASTEQLETDNSNLDYFLQVGSLNVSQPIYVEIQGKIYDNDSIGPMIRESDGTFLTAIACNDYDGAGHRNGQEAIIEHATAPTDYYEGSYVLALGDLVDPSSAARVGLFYDGSEAHYYLNGSWRGSAMRTASPAGAGLASFASSGTPGAEYEYLWVGSDPIDFDPHLRGSQATATLGTEAGF